MRDVDLKTKSVNDVILLSEYDVPAIPPPPKQVDTRGYLYLLVDSAYPEYIKIGKTASPRKRLQTYNSDRPIATCRFINISELFLNCTTVEKVILTQVHLDIQPIGKSTEWFAIEHKQTLIDWIIKAEAEAVIA